VESFGHQNLFAFSGFDADAIAIAARAFDPALLTDEIADRWANSYRSAYFSAVPSTLKDWRSMALVPSGDVGTVGLFVGFDESGSLLVAENAGCKATANKKAPCDPLTEKAVMHSRPNATGWFVFGVVDASDEFVKGKGQTARAQARWRVWGEWMKDGPDVADQKIARDIIALTETYSRDKTRVGGSIDMVELRRDGIHWLARKKNCERGTAK
jgi:hypothetical protein